MIRTGIESKSLESLTNTLITITIAHLVGRVFANDPGDRGSIPRSNPIDDAKMVLDTSLLNTYHYKVRIKGNVEQSRERCSNFTNKKGWLWVPLDYGCQLYSVSCKQVQLATVVEGDQKAPFTIATTPRCRGRRYSFPWITPLYPWYIPYIAEC